MDPNTPPTAPRPHRPPSFYRGLPGCPIHGPPPPLALPEPQSALPDTDEGNVEASVDVVMGQIAAVAI